MVQVLELLARSFVVGFDLLGMTGGPAAAFALLGVVGLTTLALALTSRRLTALSASLELSTPLRVQRESTDIAVLLARTDPDAEGHARPRAPASALTVA
ncbi:MAG TPA: DUF6412 domain-containing protein [Microbacteriaceae bacterium]